MTKSESVIFRAEASKVWKYAIRVVQEAGYDHLEIKASLGFFSYLAPRGSKLRAQVVKVTVAELDDEETCVSVEVYPLALVTFTEGGLQRRLLDFILGELEDRFPKVKRRGRIKNAPGTSGTSGCAILIALVGASVVGGIVAGHVL